MIKKILLSASVMVLFAGSAIGQKVVLTDTDQSPASIVKKYQGADLNSLDVASVLALAKAYNLSGDVEKSASTYEALYKSEKLKDRNLAKYGLVLLKLKKNEAAKAVFKEYSKYDAEEAGYFLDICAAAAPQSREEVPPSAVKISDIPAYKDYPQSVNKSNQAIAVSKRTVEIERLPEMKEELDVKVEKKERVDLTFAKRVGVNELFPAATNVYFIQLASLTRSKGDVYAFKNLVSYGNLYKIRQDGKVKIKLGYFYDQWEAENILSSVKSQGYSDAFITEDNLSTGDLELALSSYDVGTTVSSTTSSTTTSETTTTSHSYMPETVYKVRLASYEDPIWFDIEKARRMGQIEQWTKGAWTIFILSGFDSYSEAQKGKDRAIAKGFVDAEVVMDNGGVLESM